MVCMNSITNNFGYSMYPVIPTIVIQCKWLNFQERLPLLPLDLEQDSKANVCNRRALQYDDVKVRRMYFARSAILPRITQ